MNTQGKKAMHDASGRLHEYCSCSSFFAKAFKNARISAFAFLFLFAFASLLMALNVGEYTDYTWQSDYHPPQPPAARKIDCNFFTQDKQACESLPAGDDAASQALLLGIIRTGMPEQDQDLVRRWNGLGVGNYFENVSMHEGAKIKSEYGANDSDGMFGENGSLRNAWFRLLNLYPSVYDERDGHFYLGEQTLMQTASRIKFVVPNPQGEKWCSQSYDIKGYDFTLKASVGDFSTYGRILPTAQLLSWGQKANLTLTFEAIGEYSYTLSPFLKDEENNTTTKCASPISNHTIDTISLSQNYPIKRYPNVFEYSNVIAIPQKGLAQGIARIKLPSDFISYTLKIKGYTYTVGRNEMRLVSRGKIEPLLRLDLIPAPSKGGTLDVTSIVENDENGIYEAQLRYRLPIGTPDIAQQDCTFIFVSPFGQKTVANACEPTRSPGKISLQIIKIENGFGLVEAKVTDPIGNAREGVNVQFRASGKTYDAVTNSQGIAQAWIEQQSSMAAVEAHLPGSEEIAETQAMLFLPGKGQYAGQKSLIEQAMGQAPTILILLMVIGLMTWVVKRRSSTILLLAFAIAMLLPLSWAEDLANGTQDVGGVGDLQATLLACQNYDFTNAVRHFGECAQAYQLANEFSSMRRTALVLIANIAPLVVATPDIAAYKDAYVSMTQIALALFRVAWAFNSLYLILNIFNPTKRNEALKQYIWLIVFVIFAYFSFSIIRESISAINGISTWIAGTDAASTLTQAGLSAQFVAENYEMLKLVLPFLNITYLVLLARYVSVIGLMLFFPFSLLLFFTSATRGFGRAALTVTFAALGLGVINSILLLIYSILTKTTDPALAGSFAATFFSASFIVFFGFVNLLVLLVAFLAGIVFIGQRGEA